MSERPTRIELNKIAMLVVGNPEGLRDAECDFETIEFPRRRLDHDLLWHLDADRNYGSPAEARNHRNRRLIAYLERKQAQHVHHLLVIINDLIHPHGLRISLSLAENVDF